MDFRLNGKVAVVTGGSSGIGLAIALGLAREGAALVVCGRKRERLAAAQLELEKLESAAVSVVADVATPAGCDTVIDTALQRFGYIDILINNAGGAPGPAGFLALQDEHWQQAFDLDLMSAVRCSRAAIPHMQKRGGGRIVNIGSTSGHQPDVVVCAYNAAKAALINLSKTLANSFAKDNILVNCVCPGLTRTPAVEASARRRLEEGGQDTSGLSADECVQAYFGPRRPMPLGRVGSAEEVASIVVFLCSQQASWITGTCIDADGGWTKSML
jgi:NAD(P)-dependent dehydrogenase (short-subunit alcohol dehydrogenase family)